MKNPNIKFVIFNRHSITGTDISGNVKLYQLSHPRLEQTHLLVRAHDPAIIR